VAVVTATECVSGSGLLATWSAGSACGSDDRDPSGRRSPSRPCGHAGSGFGLTGQMTQPLRVSSPTVRGVRPALRGRMVATGSQALFSTLSTDGDDE